MDPGRATPAALRHLSDAVAQQVLPSRGVVNAQAAPAVRFERPRAVERVLPEEDYAAHLHSIIERDFFPGLPRLRAHLELLNAQQSADEGRIAAAEAALHEPQPLISSRPPFSGSAPSSDTPLLHGSAATLAAARAADADEVASVFSWSEGVTGPSAKRRKGDAQSAASGGTQADDPRARAAVDASRLGLDAFLRGYTGEDNAAAAAASRELEAARARRHWWLYEHVTGSRARLLLTDGHAGRAAGPSGADLQGSASNVLGVDVLEDRAVGPVQPGSQLRSWRFRPRNALFWAPDLAASYSTSRVAGRAWRFHPHLRLPQAAMLDGAARLADAPALLADAPAAAVSEAASYGAAHFHFPPHPLHHFRKPLRGMLLLMDDQALPSRRVSSMSLQQEEEGGGDWVAAGAAATAAAAADVGLAEKSRLDAVDGSDCIGGRAIAAAAALQQSAALVRAAAAVPSDAVVRPVADVLLNAPANSGGGFIGSGALVVTVRGMDLIVPAVQRDPFAPAVAGGLGLAEGGDWWRQAPRATRHGGLVQAPELRHRATRFADAAGGSIAGKGDDAGAGGPLLASRTAMNAALHAGTIGAGPGLSPRINGYGFVYTPLAPHGIAPANTGFDAASASASSGYSYALPAMAARDEAAERMRDAAYAARKRRRGDNGSREAVIVAAHPASAADAAGAGASSTARRQPLFASTPAAVAAAAASAAHHGFLSTAAAAGVGGRAIDAAGRSPVLLAAAAASVRGGERGAAASSASPGLRSPRSPGDLLPVGMSPRHPAAMRHLTAAGRRVVMHVAEEQRRRQRAASLGAAR